MKILGVIDEDFINYKKPSMVIEFPFCDFKCEKDCGEAVCQNSPLVNHPIIEVSAEALAKRYVQNPITSAVVLQGLEPLDSMYDVGSFLMALRYGLDCQDDVVIYTGYNKEEVENKIRLLTSQFDNIVVKFGRFVPHQTPHYDDVLGVKLASDNQYAERYQ